MKFNSKKIKCVLFALTMVLVCATSIFATPYEYEECGDDHIHINSAVAQTTGDISVQEASSSCVHSWSVGYCGRTCTKCGTVETFHSWSVGWCGQTCTRCGTVEVFHAPGGCWYCK